MKEQLQEIHNAITAMFEYNIDSYKTYKANVERALNLIQSIPETKSGMLKNWKDMATVELQKELNTRLSDKFLLLSPEEQKSDLKFSKMSVSMMIMNIIMYI